MTTELNLALAEERLCSAPPLQHARQQETDTYMDLRAALDEALAQASRISVHYSWLEEIQDWWNENPTPSPVLLGIQSGRLADRTRRHSIFPQEKEECLRVVKALDRWADARSKLAKSERQSLEQQMSLHRLGKDFQPRPREAEAYLGRAATVGIMGRMGPARQMIQQ